MGDLQLKKFALSLETMFKEETEKYIKVYLPITAWFVKFDIAELQC